MSFEWRGGIPTNQVITVGSTPTHVFLQRDQNARLTTKWLRLSNRSVAPINIFWTEEEIASVTNVLTLGAVGNDSAIFSAPIEATEFWAMTPGTATLEVLSVARRG